MPTITYDELISSFLMKGEIYNLFSEDITDEYRNNFLWGLIRSAIGDPYVRRLFTIIAVYDPGEQLDENGDVVVDEETEEPVFIEGHIEYQLEKPVNEAMDKQFIVDVIGYGMLSQWMSPLVFSNVNIVQMYGTSAEKFYAQANHNSVNMEMLDKVNYLQRKLIRDRGLVNNDYISGNSASSRLRGGAS